MPEVVLQNVSKHYGQIKVVEDLSLNIANGDLVALLGPSGCGKTTTLRMIAGFVEATSGRIHVGGRDVTALPPNERNMGLVFQNYALFPHMTVAENVAFGLEMRKVSKADASKRVREMLARVRLLQYADRLPKQLSGGQQQRVALARALVIEPDVLLLDEPLSNLDATLRNEMKIEIRQLQQSLGLTTIFVTHDQDEAMSTADCMVLMHKGKVEQMGPPDEVFGRPRTAFAAGFLGIPNLLPGRAVPETDSFRVQNGPTLRVADHSLITGSAYLALRPEEITLSTQVPAAGPNILVGKIELMTYHGASVSYQVRTNDGLLLSARVRAPGLGGIPILPTGTQVHAHWAPEAGVLVHEQ